MLSEGTRKAIYIEAFDDAESVYAFMSVVMKGSNKEWGKVVRELNDMDPDEKGSRAENSRKEDLISNSTKLYENKPLVVVNLAITTCKPFYKQLTSCNVLH